MKQLDFTASRNALIACVLIGSSAAYAAPDAPPPQDVSAVEVQRLLQNNACLTCHGLQTRLIGPGFAEIATKLKADPKAAARLESSIRGGSQGRWGGAPMPPFTQLKPEEAKALAAFVLEQK